MLFILTRVPGAIYGLFLLQSLLRILLALVRISQEIVDYTQVVESGGNSFMVLSIDTFMSLQGLFVLVDAIVVLPKVLVSNS